MPSPRVWLVLVAVAAVVRFDTQATFIVLPADISAIAGETVVLRCSVHIDLDTMLYWTKGDVHLSFSERLLVDQDKRSRYSLTGNRTVGEYDLTIENVKKSDAGQYKCSYFGATEGRVSPPANITVYVPPPERYPLCHVRAQRETSDTTTTTLWPGAGAEFTCLSAGGDPPALLQWFRANHSILEPQPSHIVYARILLREDNGVSFTCVATSPALRQPRTCTVTPMRIPPVVQVRPLTRMIIPGDNATFHCEGSAIPHVASYSWRVAGRGVTDGHPGYSFANQRQLLTIHDVKQSHDELEVACEATTPTGIAESASVKMVVTPIYVPPQIVTQEPPIDFSPRSPENGVAETDPGEDLENIINGALFLVILTIFGALVILLLVVAVVMGCWALNSKGKRPQTQKRPRVEYHESTAKTIDMEPLPLPTPIVYEPPTTIASDPIAIPAAFSAAVDRENAPGYISQLYSTLDNSRLPSRAAFGTLPDRPVAQITPTQGVASTLPRTGRLEKPCGTGKAIIKECPASFTVPEEKVEHDQIGNEKDGKEKDKH